MKKMSLALFSVAILIVLTGEASATNVSFTTTVKNIYPQNDGDVILQFSTDSSSCTNGSSPKQYVLAESANGVTTDGAKNLYAAVLLAFSLGKSVLVVFDDATSNCYINRIQVIG